VALLLEWALQRRLLGSQPVQRTLNLGSRLLARGLGGDGGPVEHV